MPTGRSSVFARLRPLGLLDKCLLACCALAVGCLAVSWSVEQSSPRPYIPGDKFTVQDVTEPIVVLWASSACQACREVLPVIRAASEPPRRLPLHVMSREPISLIRSMLDEFGIQADRIVSASSDQAVHLTRVPMVLSVSDSGRILAIWSGKSQLLASEAVLSDLFRMPPQQTSNVATRVALIPGGM